MVALFGMSSVALGRQKAPAAPGNVQASGVTSSSVVLSWSAVARATSYDLELNGAPVSSTTATSYTFGGLSACTSYTFGVRSRNAQGVSIWVTATAQTAGCQPPPPPTFSPLHASGVNLTDGNANNVFLHGVNRAGTEYSCIHNVGFFDGTGTDFVAEDAEILSMADWGINSEMITLNEDCWLGINGVPAAYSNSGTSPPTPGCSASQCPYAHAIENLVQTDEQNHIYPVISLMFAAPGTTVSSAHIPLADNDHAPLFWEEVADFFKGDPYVIFRLEEEPTLSPSSEGDWQCWSRGDVSYSTSSVHTPPTAPTATGTPNACSGLGIGYQTVGMQSLVNVVRGTGATNIIALPGLAYSNMVACGATTNPSSCGMLDPSTPPVADSISPAQLMVAVDVYPEMNTCGEQLNTSCYEDTYKPVANVMPLVAGEIGEGNPSTGYGPPFTYVNMLMSWLDANGNGYFPYAWDPWTSLIPSYGNNDTPQTAWGTDYYNHIHSSTPAR